MPVIEEKSFQPLPFLSNPHIQTIFPALFRKSIAIAYKREKLTLADGDFLDLDWSRVGGTKLVILLHGLESNSQANYITRLVHFFNEKGIDTLSPNFRGCGGEPNRYFYTYHSGKTEDIQEIVNHVLAEKTYKEIAMIGFSLGGNMLLKWLGEKSNALNEQIKVAAAISVPCHLSSSSAKLSRSENVVYARRFLTSLKKKISLKRYQSPEWFNWEKLAVIKTIKEFDTIYTAPVNGYASADEYYEKNSCRNYLKNVEIPTLLLNALDDPFLSRHCMPFVEANANPKLFFHFTRKGGHVGFHSPKIEGKIHWHEQKIVDFICAHLSA